MKKHFSKYSRKGLPGGANEQQSFTEGFIVSKRGQWDFPGKPTMIPNANGRITMQGVEDTLFGFDDQGNSQIMYPGGEYQFPGNHVFEIPLPKAQMGIIGTTSRDKGYSSRFGSLNPFLAYKSSDKMPYAGVEYVKPLSVRDPNLEAALAAGIYGSPEKAGVGVRGSSKYSGAPVGETWADLYGGYGTDQGGYAGLNAYQMFPLLQRKNANIYAGGFGGYELQTKLPPGMVSALQSTGAYLDDPQKVPLSERIPLSSGFKYGVALAGNLGNFKFRARGYGDPVQGKLANPDPDNPIMKTYAEKVDTEKVHFKPSFEISAGYTFPLNNSEKKKRAQIEKRKANDQLVRELEAIKILNQVSEDPEKVDFVKQQDLKKKMLESPQKETRYRFQEGGESKDAMNAMMKARLAYANEFGNPAAQRMVVAPDQPYDFGDGDYGTHYMANMDNYAVPQIQKVNGQLVLGDFSPRSNETIRFDRPEDAAYFARHYKDIAPDPSYREYKKGGNTYQEGGNHGGESDYEQLLKAYNWGLQEFAKRYYKPGEYTQEDLEQDYQALAENPGSWDPNVSQYTRDKSFVELNQTPCGTAYHCAQDDPVSGVPVFKKPNPADYVKKPITDRKHHWNPLWEVNPSTGKFRSSQPESEAPVRYRFQDGGSIELELTDEEIEQYKKGGYIVEELPKAQEGVQKEQDLPGMYAYGDKQKKKKFADILDQVKAFGKTVEGRLIDKENLYPDFSLGSMKEYVQDVKDYQKQATEYEKARRLVKEGKMSTSSFADRYERNDWSRFDPNVKKINQEDQQKLEDAWYGTPDEYGRRRWMDDPRNVATVAKVVAGAAPLAPFAPAVLANPLAQAALTGYGIYDAGANTLPAAYEDFQKGDYGSMAGNLGWAALDLMPGMVFDDMYKAGKHLREGYKTLRGVDDVAAAAKSIPVPKGGIPDPKLFSQIGDFEFKPFSPGWESTQKMKAIAAGPQRKLADQDFYTDTEFAGLLQQQMDYNKAKQAFDEANPITPGEQLFGALTGNNERDILFSNLYPNASMPNFRKKFTTPEQEALLQKTIPFHSSVRQKGEISPMSVSMASKTANEPNQLSRDYQRLNELQQGKSWLQTGDAKDVVNEMRGELKNVTSKDIEKASPEQLEKWRNEIVDKAKKQATDRISREMEKPYTASDAMGTVTYNLGDTQKASDLDIDKAIDWANPNKEAHQIISDTITEIRSDKMSRWSSGKGKRRLQNMIDNTPWLRDNGITPENYVEAIASMDDTNLMYLNNLQELDKNISKQSRLNSYVEQGLMTEDQWMTEMIKLDEEAKLIEQSILNNRSAINSSGPFNAYMRGHKPVDLEATLNQPWGIDDKGNPIPPKAIYKDAPHDRHSIAVGESNKASDLKQIIEHEIGHLLQKGAMTNLDKELEGLTLKADDLFSNISSDVKVGQEGWKSFKESPSYFKESKDYFKTGSKGREKLPFLLEVRQDMLDRGVIKDIYDPISPTLLKNHYDKYMRGELKGDKTISLRIFDIMENTNSNFGLLSKVINKAPVMLPAAGAAGAIGLMGSQTESKEPFSTFRPNYQTGGLINNYKIGDEITEEEAVRLRKLGYEIEEF